MEVLKDYPLELEIGSSMESFQKAMESQKQLFHTQTDQLRNIVVTQCNLTGVNPLSQEMAADALSIKIGKRPRDLLNPKAVKYMQSVFSIKDTISKKECREISALFGITVTQVREYFANQRSRVRKRVRLSREKALRSTASKELQDAVTADCDPTIPIDPTPLNSVGPSSTEESPSCANQDEVLPGLGQSEKLFVENIFSSMCKEETFSGQVKLMDWILQIDNHSVLCWFLTKGGVMILATWLSQAANEEQTSVLSVALKVLCHLPLHRALPEHMSAILQAINRLRFYRISDISNSARVLLSKWSKIFFKRQDSRKTNGIKSACALDIDLRQRIGELIGDDSWQSSHDIIAYANQDDTRKMEFQQGVKLLTATSDESNKKHILGTSSTYNKERRKVLLVEQPGRKAAGKSPHIKTIPASQARPITADEIQKAKIRAQCIQSNKTRSEGPKKPSLLTNDLLSASEAYLRPKLEAQKKARLLPPKSSKQIDSPCDHKSAFDEKESLIEKCRRVQIPWQAPPEFQVNAAWEIGTGESSKETEVQRNRMRREKETIYRTPSEIPPNPKDPWDIEMDYDDTLTPDIPIEQLPDPDADGCDTDTPLEEIYLPETQNPNSVPLPNHGSTSNGPAVPEPDLELLAVLLKNPELVFALTSGQASGLSSEDTVKLLDMIKSSDGVRLLSNGLAGNPEEEKKAEISLPSPTPSSSNVEVSLPSPTPPSRFPEVSLPSPTPSSNFGPSGWGSEAAKNPFSRHTSDRLHNTSTLLQCQLTTGSINITNPPFSHQLSSQTQPTPGPSRVAPIDHHRMHLQTHISGPHPVPEDSNRAMVKARHGIGLAPNCFPAHGNQNLYNNTIVRDGSGPGPGPGLGSVAFPGSLRDRSDFNPEGGFESWGPENSPGMYPPEYYHGQRGYAPPDRFNRNQNYWRGGGGGGGGRRWNDGDRRR